MEDLYSFYVEIYGKVLGGVLGIEDWERPKNLSERLTMSLAMYHAKEGHEMLTKSDFEKELKRLLESPTSQDTGVTYERDS